MYLDLKKCRYLYWKRLIKSCDVVSVFCSKGYTDVVKVPEGSTHLKVRQYKAKGQSRYTAYLALRRPGGEYLLNGKFMISTSETIIPLNGSVLNYTGWSQRDEALHSMGPGALQESLVVQILATDSKKPLDIRYSFYMPRKMPLPPRTVIATSGTAAALSSVEIVTFMTEVPATTEPPTTTTPAGPRWVTGSWMTCSRTCDTGWQSRTVQCKDPQGKLSKSCPLSTRPSAFKHCLIKKCWGPLNQTNFLTDLREARRLNRCCCVLITVGFC